MKSMDSRVLDTTILDYCRARTRDTEHMEAWDWIHTQFVLPILTAASKVQEFADDALELVEATIRDYKPVEITESKTQTIDLGKMLDRAAVEGAVKRLKKED